MLFLNTDVTEEGSSKASFGGLLPLSSNLRSRLWRRLLFFQGMSNGNGHAAKKLRHFPFPIQML